MPTLPVGTHTGRREEGGGGGGEVPSAYLTPAPGGERVASQQKLPSALQRHREEGGDDMERTSS